MNILEGIHVTRQEIYEQIVQLTHELESTNIAVRIFIAAEETGDAKKVQEIFDEFKKDNAELYQKIVRFGEEFGKHITTESCEIFGEKDDEEEGIHVFNPCKVYAESLCILTYLANIDELYLFADAFEDTSKKFLDALDAEGSKALADFMANASWVDYVGEDEQYATISELLVAIFNGDFANQF